MKRSRTRLALVAGLSALAAVPVLGSAPESLLPPGFGDPDTLPPPIAQPERPAPAPQPSRPATPAPSDSPAVPPVADAAQRDLGTLAPPERRIFDVPEAARRDPRLVGVLGPANRGLAPDAWGNGNGAFLASLMGRIDAPLASRWGSMLLRRALLTRVAAPGLVDPVDWVAERAALLLRMGEADAARMLVQSVDVDLYTPRMIVVATETALATADPAALCPLVVPGRQVSDQQIWPLAEAMCAALEGEASRAGALMDQARRAAGRGIDFNLAEKIVGAGTESGRAVTLEWEAVDGVNPWRFGLAAAAGVRLPDRLMDGAGPAAFAWLARAPMVPLAERVDAAEVAASIGVFSHDSLIETYSLLFDRTDVAEQAGTVGARLRTAYAASDPADRVAALRALWDEAATPHARHARRILSAGAASRIRPDAAHGAEAGELVAAMLAAGMDRQAARWSGVFADEGAEADRGWALLAVGAPDGTADRGRIAAYRGRDNSPRGHRGDMLVAALAGLERLPLADAQSLSGDHVDFARETRWSRFLDNAARAGQPATVALIAAAGLQTAEWRGVPPEHLFHIVRALRLAGLDYEARMIAAEALSRL